MSWYVYLPLSLNSANQTRSKSMSLRLFWLSKISRHPTWHAPNVTSPHLIAPKSFGATECPENVDEKPRRHESFDEKSSLFHRHLLIHTLMHAFSGANLVHGKGVFLRYLSCIWYDISLYNPFWWWCYRFYGRHALGVSAEMAHLCAGSSVKSSFAEVFSKGLGHLSSVFRQDQHVFISVCDFGYFLRLFPPLPHCPIALLQI